MKTKGGKKNIIYLYLNIS